MSFGHRCGNVRRKEQPCAGGNVRVGTLGNIRRVTVARAGQASGSTGATARDGVNKWCLGNEGHSASWLRRHQRHRTSYTQGFCTVDSHRDDDDDDDDTKHTERSNSVNTRHGLLPRRSPRLFTLKQSKNIYNYNCELQETGWNDVLYCHIKSDLLLQSKV